jgi:hypothetical protein
MTVLPGTDAEPWNAPFPEHATASDIEACFRLLLGRRPNREEWVGHRSRVGEPLDLVVASYVNALEFSRRGLQEPMQLGGLALAQLPGFAIYAESGDAAVGTHVQAGSYEPDVTAVFRRFLRPGGHVLDLGANIGYFTMLSAHLVGPRGSVTAVEPNPRNARMIAPTPTAPPRRSRTAMRRPCWPPIRSAAYAPRPCSRRAGGSISSRSMSRERNTWR